MEPLLLESVLPELRRALVGRTVSKVQLVGPHGLWVQFSGSRAGLYASAHPELSRVGLVETPPAVGEPRPAPDSLARTLHGARLVVIDAEARGRVARLGFEGAGRHRSLVLVAELIPRFANVVLVGDAEHILWARREFAGGGARRIAPGERYVPPRTELTAWFPDLDASTIRAKLDGGEGPLHRRLPRAWGGGALGFARVFEAAELDVAERLAAFAAASSPPAPTLLRHDANESLALFPADPGSVPGWTRVPTTSANDAIDRWARALEESDAGGQLAGELRRVLTRRRSRAAKARTQIEARLADAEREAEYRAQAELLTAHQSRIKRGMKSATLPAFDGSGDVTIPLDPTLDPRGNVEALFKKARRVARGRDELESQLAQQIAESEICDRALARIEANPDALELEELVRELAPSLLEAPNAKTRGEDWSREASPRHPSLPEGFAPRVYELPGGWIVWVGRNSKQNDELTHRQASQRDLWFHARGSQGSHTVLRVSSGKGEPPREIVEAAAAIAAFHSKARNSKLVPVAYTEKRYVRKPRKAPVGTAVMMREKVVMVAPRVPQESGA